LEDDEGRRETGDEALIRSLIERQVAVPTVDAASCRRIYEQQPQRFRSPDIYEVRHILLAAPPSDKAARDAARVMAARLIADIAAHPDHFAELAAQNSLCPSARSGGSLGQISQGQTVPEFEMALRGLPTGVVAPQPVETRYGVHVVCVDRHIEGSYLPFELVSERIAQWLAAKARREAIRQYIAFLASRAEIEGIDLDTADQRFASPGA
jgi:peptidyl-prolyl cis-trans isomerase C